MTKLAYIPDDHPVPGWIRDRDPLATAVWVNTSGGVTYRLDHGYLKWFGPGKDATGEIDRLNWTGTYAVVPQVLDHGIHDGRAWILTSVVPGASAVEEPWLSRPGESARAIGAALRHFHDNVPAAQCPFDWSVETRLRRAGVSAAEAEEALGPPPPVDLEVVCHGDPCAPNTLLGEDGQWTAHVDLSSLGTADRWADIAVATYSLEWNYGPGYEDVLLASYGVEPDPVRTAYYRGLWDLT